PLRPDVIGPGAQPADASGQATSLPHAFTTETLHDPGAWNMDTGASSHLNSSVTSLNTVFSTCIYPSISVGDGHFIPVTNTGHSILPTATKSLHLNNVLITPHIVNNLIYVRQFVRDNKCTIEFDAFGFFVKDFLTRRVLFRCDNTGDLYPVTAPSSIPHAFLLGKHVRLSFVSSRAVISSCFDIIHSDVWTSPILSLLVSDQHAPTIIQNPSVNPNPDSVHPMVTRFCVKTNHLTERLNLHVSSISSLPKSYRDAFNDPNWQNVMRDEYIALIKNKTWTLVPRPPDTNIVRFMWLLRHKYLADGTPSRYKARLVTNDTAQMEGIDGDETFSLVVKSGTIQAVLSLPASRHWPIHQLDVKNAFLHEDLSETVYMHQPPGFRDSTHPDYKKYAIEILKKAHIVSCNLSRTHVDTESELGVDGDPCEAKYRGVANAVAETCWLRNLLRELHTPLSFATLVYCDNAGAVYLSSNPVQHQRTKHIEIDIHFVRDLVDAGHVRVLHVPSRYQFTDIFTKGLPPALFEEFHSSLSIRCPPAPTAGWGGIICPYLFTCIC
nr:ribonuclease H-like domain-containing protein [Tanacetum cinerariifolium]